MFKSKKFLLGIIGVLLLLGISFFIFRSYDNRKLVPPTSPTPTLSNEAILEGTVGCLPHKKTDGPQTLECAIGLQTDDGKYFALDSGSQPPAFNTGERIRATGTLTPIENLSSDHWQKYDVLGILTVTDVEILQ